jgi:hypothetical protein
LQVVPFNTWIDPEPYSEELPVANAAAILATRFSSTKASLDEFDASLSSPPAATALAGAAGEVEKCRWGFFPWKIDNDEYTVLRGPRRLRTDGAASAFDRAVKDALKDICTLMRPAGAAAAGVTAATHEDRSDFASRRSLIDIGDALKH